MNKPFFKTPKKNSHVHLGKFYAFELKKTLTTNLTISFPKTLKVRLLKFIWFDRNQN